MPNIKTKKLVKGRYKLIVHKWVDIKEDLLKIKLEISKDLQNLLCKFAVLDEEDTVDVGAYDLRRRKVKRTLINSLHWRTEHCFFFTDDILKKGTLEFSMESLGTSRDIVENLKYQVPELIKACLELQGFDKTIEMSFRVRS